MKTKCIHEDLIFYLDSELSIEKRTAVEKHLEECADCRSFLAFIQESMQIIGDEKNKEVTPFFYTRLSARLDEKEELQRQSSWVRLAFPVFFSVLMIAGIYGGIKIGASTGHPGTAIKTSNGLTLIVNDFKSEPIENYLLEEL